MDEKLREMGLADIRENGSKDTGISFSKGILGGYNTKEVDDYIKILKDRLAGAENSYRERLEEFSVMTSMLTQEKDKYKALSEISSRDIEAMSASINNLQQENTSLKLKAETLEQKALTDEELDEFRRMSARSVVLERIAEEHETVLMEKITLSEQLDVLKKELEAKNGQIKVFSEIDEEKTQRLASLSTQLEALKKQSTEYDELVRISSEQKRKLDRYETADTEKNQKINNLSVNNERLKKQCEDYVSKNIQLTKSVELLQQAEERLGAELNERIMNEIDKNEYNALVVENKQLRGQKDELSTEINILMSGKKLLTEENLRLSEQLSRLNKRNCELHEEQGRTRIQTNTLISDIKARTFEYSQNHRRNYELMNESLKMLVKLIDTENEDIIRLCGIQTNISLQDDAAAGVTATVNE